MGQQTYSPKQHTALTAIIRLAHDTNLFIAPAEDGKQLDRAIRIKIMYIKTGLRAMNERVLIHDFKVQSRFVVKYKRKPTFSVSYHPFAVVPLTSVAERN